MTANVAHGLLDALAIYAAIGTLVGLPLVIFGLGRIDPATKDAPPVFRVLIFPGVVALWPFFVARTLR
jgi:hypothetical protein